MEPIAPPALARSSTTPHVTLEMQAQASPRAGHEEPGRSSETGDRIETAAPVQTVQERLTYRRRTAAAFARPITVTKALTGALLFFGGATVRDVLLANRLQAQLTHLTLQPPHVAPPEMPQLKAAPAPAPDMPLVLDPAEPFSLAPGPALEPELGMPRFALPFNITTPVATPAPRVLSDSGLFITQPQAYRDVNTAERYLGKSAQARAILHELQLSGGPAVVRDTEAQSVFSEQSLDAKGNAVIAWDRSSLLKSLLPSSNVNSQACGTSSAASNLLHEVVHLIWQRRHPAGKEVLRELDHALFDNYEEARVIERVNIAANELGESERGTHGGADVPAANVTDTNNGICAGAPIPSRALDVIMKFSNAEVQLSSSLALNSVVARNVRESLANVTKPVATQLATQFDSFFDDRARLIEHTFDEVGRRGTEVDIAGLWQNNTRKAIGLAEQLDDVLRNKS